MKWIMIILLILCIGLFFLIISKINIKIQYVREADTNHFHIRVKALYGLVHFLKKSELKSKPEEMAIGIKDKDVSPMKDPNESKTKKSNFTAYEMYQKFKDFLRVVQETKSVSGIIFGFMKKISILQFGLKFKIGDVEADKAAQKVGLYWALIGVELAFIQNVFHLLAQPDLEVVPIFYQKTFSVQFFCISEFRVGQLIWAGLKFIFRWKGRRKLLFIPVINEETKNEMAQGRA